MYFCKNFQPANVGIPSLAEYENNVNLAHITIIQLFWTVNVCSSVNTRYTFQFVVKNVD